MARKRWYLRKRLWIPVLLFAAGYAYIRANPLVFNESAWQHAHCIAQASAAFEIYAEKNGGKYPFHANGYPDALLLLNGPGYWGYFLTGPGFDGEVIDDAKRTGRPLTEAECGRVYIQGLTKNSNREIIFFFDKIPTPGSDHTHLPHRMWAPLCREVLRVGSGMQRIEEMEWPEIVRQQIELLVEEGFDRKEAERLYYGSGN